MINSIPLYCECPAPCPGCPHRHLDPEQSAARKSISLKKRLFPWEDRFLPMAIPALEQIPGYRQKTCLSAIWTPDGWEFGLKARREIIPISRCPLHSERIRRALEILSPVLPPEPGFPLAYWVQSGSQVVLILKTNVPPDTTWLSPTIETALHESGIDGLWIHLFPSVGKKVFAKSGWRLAWGVPRSRGADGFVYGPTAFQQVFPGLHESALDRAESFLDAEPADRVIDLYSGIGHTLARWTDRGAKTVGVELCGEAVACAIENVPLAEIFRGTCAHRLVQIDQWLDRTGGPAREWKLYVNPPRTGLEQRVAEWIIERRPRKMAYLSCSAGTLHRDLDLLCATGYRVEAIAPYDFFPRTRHVETLVMLEDGGKIKKWKPESRSQNPEEKQKQDKGKLIHSDPTGSQAEA